MPVTAFSGYQLLLEYFSFRPKFMFVELRGLDTIGLTAASTWFEIDIVLSEAWSSDLPFETENFRLHCAPVINLFTLEADPLTLNPLENEYLLRPLRLQDGHTEIYSVDNIHGAVKNGKHPYVPFTSFRHRGGMMRHDAPERYFHTGNRIRLSQRATLGKTAREACSRVLVTLETEDPGEAEGWLPGAVLHTDLLVLLRVYLGYRSDARLRLTVPVRLLPEPRVGKGRRIQLGRTGLLGLKAGKLSNNRESLTVSLGCYEGLQCSVLPPAEDGHYRFD
ncbi:type VI secretion protein [Klebsiella pneumoniae]|nr:type VI secretion protein [Klebsiella pneumoniae]SYO12347.1 type VI secretion protein [Klebsiella pneumoniae]